MHGFRFVPVFAGVVKFAHLHSIVVTIFDNFDLGRFRMADCVTAHKHIIASGRL
ncbi:MAG: CRISPR-associated DxTHG motif protein [Gammaproteobacteria bacterium]|nr:CRISPR-associated DxTHG motif protein [Gammaproteobacteria bacterium]NPA78896.1 CRISPR-associated DxTHG motif protein [Gammaproteobacteria bacterium]